MNQIQTEEQTNLQYRRSQTIKSYQAKNRDRASNTQNKKIKAVTA